jgi:pimeloyl-ACP methyl ester carboxylesterase
MSRKSPIQASYVYVDLEGTGYRVYYEEAGEGIPVILQHTAQADGRQWRHLLEDEDLTREFRFLAPDLPRHGKSLPPESERWWDEPYKLTKSFFEEFVLGVADATGMDRPVFMGCSMGGHLAIDLAIDHPDSFRAVIGVEAGMETHRSAAPELGYFDHPRISSSFRANFVSTIMGPNAPERYRQETTFLYGQGGPGIFAGDVNYYAVEHDVSETARTIDTERIPVYIYGGDYDWSATPEVCAELAKEIPGSKYIRLNGFGHFPMAEDPELFKRELLPVLDAIKAAGLKPRRTKVADDQ